MNSWPIDDRFQSTGQATKNKGSKATQGNGIQSYFKLYPGSNAATLVEKNGVLEWTFLTKNETQGPKLRMGESTTILPATRPATDRPIKKTVLQSVERGTNFLRTIHPDVDIPVELIKKELIQNEQINRKLMTFDPYTGNLLESIVTSDGSGLVFPMGELFRELNLSIFRLSDRRFHFEPSSRPAYKFDTPIRQIATPPAPSNGPYSPYLAVRTYGGTSLLEVSTREALALNEVAVISYADVAGRALVDISLSTAPLELLVVNDLGSMYQCTLFGGKKDMRVIHPSGEDVNSSDSFWRLSRGADNMNCFLVSKDTLRQFDLRTNKSQRLLLLERGEAFTGVEDEDNNHIVKLCSTSDILWVDTRFPRNPLLGYRHGRQYDRSLRTHTSPTSPEALTLLSSRNNTMMTVYDVSRSGTELLYANVAPYCFFPGHLASGIHLGQAFLSDSPGSNTFSLVQLNEQGSISHVDFSLSGAGASAFEVSWLKEAEGLKNKSLRGTQIPYDDQTFVEMDFSPAFDRMFTEYLEGDEKEDIDATDSCLEAISTFWQEAETPVQHILTTFDVVFRAGDEPDKPSRSNFLSESTVNSHSGYRAVAQGRLSPGSIAQGAVWHCNINPTLRHLGLNLANDIQDTADALGRHDLLEDPKRSAESVRWEKEAREQLALDLVLSSDIYSSRPLPEPFQKISRLEDMARSLSLDGEPPSVEFGFFRPMPNKHYRDDADVREVTTSIGVRSLLKDWDIGADMENYKFVDCYAGTVKQPTQPNADLDNSNQLLESQSKRPPKILATSIIPSQPLEVKLMAHSQGSGPPQVSTNDMASSQEMITNTQILPGAYGGRPSMNKRRAIKKRVGGF